MRSESGIIGPRGPWEPRSERSQLANLKPGPATTGRAGPGRRVTAPVVSLVCFLLECHGEFISLLPQLFPPRQDSEQRCTSTVVAYGLPRHWRGLWGMPVHRRRVGRSTAGTVAHTPARDAAACSEAQGGGAQVGQFRVALKIQTEDTVTVRNAHALDTSG